jgi:hypothetical protein
MSKFKGYVAATINDKECIFVLDDCKKMPLIAYHIDIVFTSRKMLKFAKDNIHQKFMKDIRFVLL